MKLKHEIAIGIFLLLFGAFVDLTTARSAVFAAFYQNEKKAIATLRTLHAAEMTFAASGGAGNYGSLTELRRAALVDEALVFSEKNGYRFIVVTRNQSSNNPAAVQVIAVPASYPKTGRRSFFIDETGVIRGANHGGAPATIDDPPLRK